MEVCRLWLYVLLSITGELASMVCISPSIMIGSLTWLMLLILTQKNLTKIYIGAIMTV